MFLQFWLGRLAPTRSTLEWHEPAHQPLSPARRNSERVAVDDHARGPGRGRREVTMRAEFNTEAQCDEVIERYSADERGRETLGRLAAYVQSSRRGNAWAK